MVGARRSRNADEILVVPSVGVDARGKRHTRIGGFGRRGIGVADMHGFAGGKGLNPKIGNFFCPQILLMVGNRPALGFFVVARFFTGKKYAAPSAGNSRLLIVGGLFLSSLIRAREIKVLSALPPGISTEN